MPSIAKPLSATTLMIVIVYFASNIFVKDFLSLSFVILIGALVYLISLFKLCGKELKADLVRFGIKI